MRQRKAKNLDTKLAAYAHLCVDEPKSMKGRWKELFGNDNEIYLELGCGKGQFSSKQAKAHPDRNYIAVEGHETVVLRALEKAEAAEIQNIRFVLQYIQDITEFFEEGELAGIYLNFSDPWPKERHAKRRLTHTRYLKGYEKVVKSGGFVEFKTDNDDLFEFSMEEIEANGYEVTEFSRDLHTTRFESKNFTTEYEEKFKAQGKNINYVKFIL
ncbi:MAG: tRNA (guanosine(46)-N7)-methyltransferase TrmB [Anaerovoracaceae bacterium]